MSLPSSLPRQFCACLSWSRLSDSCSHLWSARQRRAKRTSSGELEPLSSKWFGVDSKCCALFEKKLQASDSKDWRRVHYSFAIEIIDVRLTLPSNSEDCIDLQAEAALRVHITLWLQIHNQMWQGSDWTKFRTHLAWDFCGWKFMSKIQTNKNKQVQENVGVVRLFARDTGVAEGMWW